MTALTIWLVGVPIMVGIMIGAMLNKIISSETPLKDLGIILFWSIIWPMTVIMVVSNLLFENRNRS